MTLNTQSDYSPFNHANIPEVQDFNVLPSFRRRGVGNELMGAIEARAKQDFETIGIGVGLHGDYGSAQRLYIKRGYVPDGRGLMYNGEAVPLMTNVMNDNSLALYLTKAL